MQDEKKTGEQEEKETIGQTFRNHHKHKKVGIALLILGIILVLAAFAGAASFAIHGHNGRGVNREMARGDMGFGRMMGGRGFERQNQDGSSTIRVSGDISSISGDTIKVDGANQTYAVNVTSSTSYTKNNDVAKQSDMKINNNIIVTGASGSDGTITATSILIR